MDWLNRSGISNFAKTAVSQAQKSIDKVLDIRDEPHEGSTKSLTGKVPAEQVLPSFTRETSEKALATGHIIQHDIIVSKNKALQNTIPIELKQTEQLKSEVVRGEQLSGEINNLPRSNRISEKGIMTETSVLESARNISLKKKSNVINHTLKDNKIGARSNNVNALHDYLSYERIFCETSFEGKDDRMIDELSSNVLNNGKKPALSSLEEKFECIANSSWNNVNKVEIIEDRKVQEKVCSLSSISVDNETEIDQAIYIIPQSSEIVSNEENENINLNRNWSFMAPVLPCEADSENAKLISETNARDSVIDSCSEQVNISLSETGELDLTIDVSHRIEAHEDENLFGTSNTVHKIRTIDDIRNSSHCNCPKSAGKNVSANAQTEAISGHSASTITHEGYNISTNSQFNYELAESIEDMKDGENRLKLQQERDNLMCQLDNSEANRLKRTSDLITNLTATLAEKEKKIADLLDEGESMAKRELKISNVAKKLRAKVKVLEIENENYRCQKEVLDAEIVELQKTVAEHKEKEILIAGQLVKLEMVTDQQEDEISKLKDQLDDAAAKLKGLQKSLDCRNQEIYHFNLEKESVQSGMEEVISVKKANEELSRRMADMEQMARDERAQSSKEINDLQCTITRIKQTASIHEESLKLEISDLQQRLEAAVSRNEELSQSIGAATKPLLRQIENLQNTHHIEILNWEKTEHQLNENLASCQKQLALSLDKERSAVQVALDMKSAMNYFEIEKEVLTSGNKELSNDLNKEKENVLFLERNLQRYESKFDAMEKSYKAKLNELHSETIFVEKQFNAEQLKTDLDEPNNIPTNDDLDISKTLATCSRSSSRSSSSPVVDEADISATTAAMEQLQIILRQREGELEVLRDDILTLEQTRTSLTHELVKLSNLAEELQAKYKQHDELEQKNQDLESKYNAVLQMYGEKAEEVDELKMDLDDVKQMYKQQIQQLLQR